MVGGGGPVSIVVVGFAHDEETEKRFSTMPVLEDVVRSGAPFSSKELATSFGSKDREENEEDPTAKRSYTFHYLSEAKFRMWTDRGRDRSARSR